MADDPNAPGIHFRTMGEGVPAIGGNISMEGERLAGRVSGVGLPGVPAGCPDAQGDEAAQCQLQAEVAERLPRVETDTGLRFIIDDEHRGKGAGSGRDQQPALVGLPRGDSDTHPVLGQPVAIRGGEDIKGWLGKHWRPRTHQSVPFAKDFLPAPGPFHGGLDHGAVTKQQG